MNRNEARNVIEKLRRENENWLAETQKAGMDGIFSIIERVRVEKKKDFILELIQNADDCESHGISFDLGQSDVLVQNDGHPFRWDSDPAKDDIRAICKLGKTTKASGKIGFMGFGFRAVFEVSKNPEIYSDSFSFRFGEDTIVPHWIEHVPPNIKSRLDGMRGRGSVFVLPGLAGELQHDVQHALKKLSPTLLLHLQHLKRIKIGQETLHTDAGPFPYSFWASRNDSKQRLWKMYRSKPLEIPKDKREFLRKDRKLNKISKEPKKYEQISITFRIEQDGKIADEQDTGLYAFLPLADEKNTKLAFNIQADFSVDAGRRKLREPNSIWNQWILTNVYRCFSSILKDYKDQNDVRTEFYKILPLNNPERPEYLKNVKKKIDEFVQNENSILVKTRKSRKHPDRRKWVRPEHAVLASSEQQELFDRKDLTHLFGKKKFYIADDEIDSDGMEYVQEVVKDAFSFDATVKLLRDSQWIINRKIQTRKNAEKWVGNLIIYLAGELDKRLEGKSWWDYDYKAEKKEFIRGLSSIKLLLTEDGKLRRPQRIFLPPSKDISIPRNLQTKYSIVSRRLVRYLEGKRVKSEEEKARRAIGLELLHDLTSELSPETITKEIINPVFSDDNWKKYSDSTLHKYTDFIRKRESCWRSADIKLKVQAKGEERNYKEPDELYLGSKYGNEFDLDSLYKGYETADFVSLDYIRKLARLKSERAKQQINVWRKFFVGIGVRKIPKILGTEKRKVGRAEIEKEAENPAEIVSTYSTPTYPGYTTTDYDFNSNLKKILSDCLQDKMKDSLKRLKILLKILDRSWDYYSEYLEAKYGFHTEGQWGRTRRRLRLSSFALFLKNSNWVPTRDGRHLKPETVAISEFQGMVEAPIIDYKLSSEEFKKFLRKLGLQTKLTVEGAVAILKSLVSQEERKLSEFRQIYTYLAQHEKERESIRRKLADSPCIFIPKRDKKYWKISEVFWEGGGFFLEWRTNVGETYPELKDFFIKTLGVVAKPTLEHYVEFLSSYLWKREKLTKKEMASLGYVYHHLEYMVTTPELKSSKVWADLATEFQVLCEDNRWLGVDESTFYNDNEKLYKLFKANTDMVFVYIPEVPRSLDIKPLFSALGIRGLSECYAEKCAVSGEQVIAEEGYQMKIGRIHKYVAQFVKEKSPDTFDRLNHKGVFSMLEAIEVIFVDSIEVEGVVGKYAVALGERKSFYSWENPENRIYLERSLQGNVSSCFRHIGIALAEAFGKDIGLETFIPYVSEMEETEIDQAMQDYGITAEEELWKKLPSEEEPPKLEPPPTEPPSEEEPPKLEPPPTEPPSEEEPPKLEPPPTEPPSEEEPPKLEPPPTEPPSEEEPPKLEPPPETLLHEREKVVTEVQIRDSRPAKWVKSGYGYHCQVCLSKEKPGVLTYDKSYAGRKTNRKSIMHGHHVKKVVKDKGHDHPGNYLSLCRHHHLLMHKLGFSLDDLSDSLRKGVGNKEIVWPSGETTRWSLASLSEKFVEGNQTLQIVIRQEHLEKIKEYINRFAS